MPEQIDILKAISEISDPKALAVISYLLEEIRQLQQEVAELKRNSSNSSEPPSSDIVKPEHERRQPNAAILFGAFNSRYKVFNYIE